MVVASYLVKYRSESFRHFMAKACLFYRLMEMGHDVISEMEIIDNYVDLCDKTTMTFYEIEFKSSANKFARKVDTYDYVGYDLIIANCRNIPDDIFQMKMFLEKFIVPD